MGSQLLMSCSPWQCDNPRMDASLKTLLKTFLAPATCSVPPTFPEWQCSCAGQSFAGRIERSELLVKGMQFCRWAFGVCHQPKSRSKRLSQRKVNMGMVLFLTLLQCSEVPITHPNETAALGEFNWHLPSYKFIVCINSCAINRQKGKSILSLKRAARFLKRSLCVFATSLSLHPT